MSGGRKGFSVEYDFYIDADLSAYSGEWIAIKGREVVGHGPLKNLFAQMKKKYIDHPLYAYVPKAGVHIWPSFRCD